MFLSPECPGCGAFQSLYSRTIPKPVFYNNLHDILIARHKVQSILTVQFAGGAVGVGGQGPMQRGLFGPLVP